MLYMLLDRIIIINVVLLLYAKDKQNFPWAESNIQESMISQVHGGRRFHAYMQGKVR